MMTKRYWPETRRVSDEGAIPQVWLWWVVDTQTRNTVREGHASSEQEALKTSVAHARILNAAKRWRLRQSLDRLAALIEDAAEDLEDSEGVE